MLVDSVVVVVIFFTPILAFASKPLSYIKFNTKANYALTSTAKWLFGILCMGICLLFFLAVGKWKILKNAFTLHHHDLVSLLEKKHMYHHGEKRETVCKSNENLRNYAWLNWLTGSGCTCNVRCKRKTFFLLCIFFFGRISNQDEKQKVKHTKFMLKLHTKTFGDWSAHQHQAPAQHDQCWKTTTTNMKQSNGNICLHKRYYLALKSHKERKTWICNVCIWIGWTRVCMRSFILSPMLTCERTNQVSKEDPKRMR